MQNTKLNITNKKFKRGNSITQLMIVLAITAVLAIYTLPSLNSYFDEVKEGGVLTDFNGFQTNTQITVMENKFQDINTIDKFVQKLNTNSDIKIQFKVNTAGTLANCVKRDPWGYTYTMLYAIDPVRKHVDIVYTSTGGSNLNKDFNLGMLNGEQTSAAKGEVTYTLSARLKSTGKIEELPVEDLKDIIVISPLPSKDDIELKEDLPIKQDGGLYEYSYGQYWDGYNWKDNSTYIPIVNKDGYGVKLKKEFLPHKDPTGEKLKSELQKYGGKLPQPNILMPDGKPIVSYDYLFSRSNFGGSQVNLDYWKTNEVDSIKGMFKEATGIGKLTLGYGVGAKMVNTDFALKQLQAEQVFIADNFGPNITSCEHILEKAQIQKIYIGDSIFKTAFQADDLFLGITADSVFVGDKFAQTATTIDEMFRDANIGKVVVGDYCGNNADDIDYLFSGAKIKTMYLGKYFGPRYAQPSYFYNITGKAKGTDLQLGSLIFDEATYLSSHSRRVREIEAMKSCIGTYIPG